MTQQNQVKNKLNGALTLLIQTLEEFAEQTNFWQILDIAFGRTYNHLRLEELRTQWRQRDQGTLPLIEIVNQEVLGSSLGAYSIDTDKIYMSEQFVVTAKLADLVLVLLEEYGHHVDAQVNAKDTPGDEGEIFAALVLGKTLDDESLRNLRAEDDSAVIAPGGEVIKIEQATFTGTNSNDKVELLGSALVSNDTYDGGSGIDTLIVDYSSASFTYLGRDGYGVTNTYTNSFEGFWHRLVYGPQPLLNYNNVEVFQITGTQYADKLRGYGGDDTLIGGEGNDDIAGGDGNDLIRGGDGNDTLKGEGGNDEIEGGDGNDTIDGGTGRHVIRAGKGDDTVVSAKAGDSIDGGEGSDTLQSLDLTSLDVDLVLDLRATEQVSGDNNTRINNFENISSVTLGSGYDAIIATGNLLVSNGSINSGGGTDTLIVDYSSASFGYLGYDGLGITNMWTDSFEAYRPVSAGWGREILLNYSNIEIFEITGTAYADYIRGYSGDDKLIGGEGNDDIAGGDGNDLIRGGDGNDFLKGEGGDDEIEGGDGNDTIGELHRIIDPIGIIDPIMREDNLSV